MLSTIRTAYLAADGFTQELIEELSDGSGEIEAIHGRLVITCGAPRKAAWAQNIWYDPVQIPITSISHGAKELRRLGKRWAFYSHKFHRRAALIQEQLPKLKSPPLRFLEAVPGETCGSWTLIDAQTVLASSRCWSVFPNGEMKFVENRVVPPSRAYLKLWELFTVHGVRPQKGELCLDFGSSPGGWTWVLQQIGCRVVSVDRAELDPKIARLPNIEFRKRNAFTLKPEDIGPVDWFFSDIICYPEQLLELVEKWRTSGLVRNFVCTIKFKGKTDHESTRRFSAMAGSKVFHQFHNKHELTWVCLS